MKQLTYIKTDRVMGRGVYSNWYLTKGAQVMACELLVLSPEDTVKVNETDLKYYTFVYNQNQDCLVLGDGEIFNHSDEPNVSYELVTIFAPETKTTRQIMVFRTLRDIEQDEQLLIDYNADTKVNTQDYVNQKSLMGK